MNSKFTAYSATTGQVLYRGEASDPSILATDAISILLDEMHDGGWIENGIHHPLPEQPSTRHVFDYSLKSWVDPRTPETEWPMIRAERDRRLAATDWIQLPDVPLTTKEAWAVYRQALRDITKQADPFNIVWPELP